MDTEVNEISRGGLGKDVIVGPRRRSISGTDLGGRIRDLRRISRLSQADLLHEISSVPGEKMDSTRFSRLETGDYRPKPKEIRAILDVLRPDLIEENKILYTAGYLPTKEDLERDKPLFEGILKDWSERGLPCVIIDAMGWRFVAWNREADNLFGLGQAKEEKTQKGINRHEEDELYGYPQFLELVLDPSSQMHEVVFSRGRETGMDFAAQQLNNFLHQTDSWRGLGWLTQITRDIRKAPYFPEVAALRRGHIFTPMWISYGFTEIPIIQKGGKRTLVEFSTELNIDPRFEILRYVFMSPKEE